MGCGLPASITPEASCACGCMAHSGQLCAVQTSQRNKESRVNMLVNRMAQSQARAQNEVHDCCLPRLPSVGQNEAAQAAA